MFSRRQSRDERVSSSFQNPSILDKNEILISTEPNAYTHPQLELANSAAAQFAAQFVGVAGVVRRALILEVVVEEILVNPE